MLHDIHAQLGLEMVNSRTEKLFHKFLLTRLNNELIQEEFSGVEQENEPAMHLHKFAKLTKILCILQAPSL